MPLRKARSTRGPAKATKKPAARGGGPALVPIWNLLLPDGTRLGEDRIQLLRSVEESGSIIDAAAVCGLSYRTAWSRVKELNSSFARPLLESVQGGAEGGRTRLSGEALNLLALHREASALFEKASAEHGLEASDAQSLSGFRRRLSLRTSVRNQYHGRVVSVEKGKVQAEVVLEIEGGAVLVSQVTLRSCESLGLRRGVEAWALVKSSWVEIAAGREAPKVSARNILGGVVSSVRKGSVNDEIGLDLAGGGRIAATVARESAERMGLAKGSAAWALFKASSVILAVE